jgi:hypothetical protein
MSNYNLTHIKQYTAINTSVTFKLKRTQHLRYAGAFINYCHKKFHMSIPINTLVTATQQNVKGTSHGRQIGLAKHKVL